MKELEAILVEEGRTYLDRFGQPKLHPAVTSLAGARRRLTSLTRMRLQTGDHSGGDNNKDSGREGDGGLVRLDFHR